MNRFILEIECYFHKKLGIQFNQEDKLFFEKVIEEVKQRELNLTGEKHGNT